MKTKIDPKLELAKINKNNILGKYFIGKYPLTKTLRFELKPTEKTKLMLEKYGVLVNDEKIAQNYQEAKKWFDKMHRQFIDQALNSLQLDNGLLVEFEKKWLASKKISADITKKLRGQIKNHFDEVAEEWRDDYLKTIGDEKARKKFLKYKGVSIFFKETVFSLLKYRYPEAEVDGNNLFETFNKFSTYFNNFHESRRNFYKDDGTSTAIATRIIDVNLPKFLQNKKKFTDKYQDNDEALNLIKEKDLFTLTYFNQCFTQSQIDDYNRKIGEINFQLNKFRQQRKKSDYPLFEVLFKQILGEKSAEKTSFIQITEDREVFSVWQELINENEKYFLVFSKLFAKLFQEKESQFDFSKIYVGSRFLNTISNKWFVNWSILRQLFLGAFNQARKKQKKYGKKLPDFISLLEIKEKMQQAQSLFEKKDFFRDKYKEIYEKKDDYFDIFLNIWQTEWEQTLKNHQQELKNSKQWLENNKNYTNKKGKLANGKEGEKEKEVIRLYAEAALNVYQMIKYFALEKGKQKVSDLEIDSFFYNRFNENYDNLHTWVYFNELRNYLTKKPYSEDKIKLNFESGNLIAGWQDSPEGNTQYKGFVFRKNGKYYLGITDYPRILDQKKFPDVYKKTGEQFYEKMIFQQLDAKTLYGSVYRGRFGSKYSDDKLKLSKRELIGRIKAVLEEKAIQFPLLRKIVDNINVGLYSNPKDLHKDISNLSLFNISFIKVNKDYIERGEYEINGETKKLFLFEIYNKDFAGGAEGRKNLHTLYWQELFSEKNQKNPVFKLSGGAEVFYRRASLEPEKERRKFKRPIVKYRRYTEDKLLFHCPIVLNFNQDKIGPKEFNGKIRKIIKKNQKRVNIIGIDRGESHLAYYSLIDGNGNILKTESLNKIGGVDYQKKLDELEKLRDKQRKSWQVLSHIKDLKRGYISQIVRKIADLAVRNNAIIVFEDLNIGFKQGRFAIEKQVYQNLELALAQKLNYLVFKDATEGAPGHIRSAYQLTPEVQNFKDIGKQCGIVFYIPAAYTSAICPVCGFRKNIPTPIGNLENNRKIISEFNVAYESDLNRFRFEYENNGRSYVFYSNVERWQYQRTKDNRMGEFVYRNPNEELKKIFSKNQIDIEKDISSQIADNNDLSNSQFFKPFIYTVRLILQLRNTIKKINEEGITIKRDFIECPVCYFHSEKNLTGLLKKYKGKEPLEFNGDANGAYNIARKGIVLLDKIKNHPHPKEMKWEDLKVTQEEWDDFVINKL